MNLDTLIAKLTEVRAEHGNINFVVQDCDFGLDGLYLPTEAKVITVPKFQADLYYKPERPNPGEKVVYLD